MYSIKKEFMKIENAPKPQVAKKLSNEDIKRVVNTYLVENNVYVYDLQLNTDKKRWYFQFISFVAHNTFMRFWNPFVDG